MRFNKYRFTLALLVFSLALPVLVNAQTPTPAKHVQVPTIAPRAEDVDTLDGIMKAFYEVISGPAGTPRQWGRDRTLYIPGVRFVSTNVKADGKVVARVMDHQEYVDAVDGYFAKAGFFEREIHRVTKTFGNITHVFSTYESRATADGPVTARGVNSVELFNDGKRWWIAAATWDEERSSNPIPLDLLP
ncbi:MAG TPA: hypothetical protein VLL54_16080 [Pyrinomonadaceae bacterium]|nr:hypothetical protein [Pyrinomonadaceae bacterium]